MTGLRTQKVAKTIANRLFMGAKSTKAVSQSKARLGQSKARLGQKLNRNPRPKSERSPKSEVRSYASAAG
jgi:hypothetical protein